MNVFVKNDLPLHPDQRGVFEAAGNALFTGLKNLKIQDLPISEYNKNYLSDYQKRLHYGIETGLYILAHALHKSKKPITETTVIDHGGGTGLLSLLAKKCGFGQVIYNDIFEPSCFDAAEIAKALSLPAAHYVHGDIVQLTQFLMQKNIKADILLSRNVFEHIYNGPSFLQSCADIPSNELVLFFATTSNPHNPAVNWYTKRLHRQAEWKGFSSRWGKASDTIRPLREIRRDIILSLGVSFSEKELEQLVSSTRGLLKLEIEQKVIQYKNTGSLPTPYDQGSNTCNPYTGNWTERLTEVEIIEQWFQEAGFDFSLWNGFYDTHYAKSWKNLISKSLNSVIPPQGKMGLFFCPFIGLAGRKR
jgi:2-polyprenyl-3-methyl-5-hydroxy-6-metoxy-1,4-benzoquinol methylase